MVLLSLVAAFPTSVYAQPDTPPPKSKRDAYAHAIGPRYDVGGRGHALGAGYLFFIPLESTPPRRWYNRSFFSVGADSRAFVGAFDQVAGGALSGVMRLAHAQGIDHGGYSCLALEAAVGALYAARDSDITSGVAHVGGHVCFLHVVDIGYAYQFPFAGGSGSNSRPSWLSSHQLAVRFHIPLGGGFF